MEGLQRVTLELSSKPFIDDSEETAYRVADELFTQWLPLIKEAQTLSLLLWTADGSELLSWSGNEEDTFEWACWIGCAEPMPLPEKMRERDKLHTHYFPKKYRPDIDSKRTYRWLRRTIEILKERAWAVTGKVLLVGTTLDNGPEFALSPFKYQLHPELCAGSTAGVNRSIVCTAVMHGDSRRYAAFPEGVPEGLSFGTFLGRQYQEFARHFGIDYLWLSNGTGFGRDTWSISGFLFDKELFFPEYADQAAGAMLDFWRDLYAACPGIQVETRGSNYSAGVEIASDAAPLKELYRTYHIAPPVNSPWAAINKNSGLELSAWMSHIAELPDQRIPFRFYIHDPWFLNSPWLDRYEREPWDLYQPLAVSRITADGSCHCANSAAFLSADNSHGEMPDQVPQEVIPLVLDAWRTAPDTAGPLVWLYPFDEYNDLARGEAPRPESVMREELFIGEALQEGLFLNTVISTAEFRRNPDAVQGRILITPVSAWTDENRSALEDFADNGGKIMLYGGTVNAPEWMLARLRIKNTAALVGRVTIQEADDPAVSNTAYIHSAYTEGGLTAVPADDPPEVLVWAEQDGQRRIVAAAADDLLYIEAILPMPEKIDKLNRNLDIAPQGTVYPTAALPLRCLARFGWKFTLDGAVMPRTVISRHDNAFFFGIFACDTTVAMRVDSPWGIPLLTGQETRIADGQGIWRPSRFSRRECRAFVRQSNGIVSSKIEHCAFPFVRDRRQYEGLQNAEFTFFPPPGAAEVEFLLKDPNLGSWNLLHGDLLTAEWHDSEQGRYAVLHNITGNLLISW